MERLSNIGRVGVAIALVLIGLAVAIIWTTGAWRGDGSPSAESSDGAEAVPAGQSAQVDPPAPGEPTESGLPMLIDLGSDSCVPCKMMAPILDELRETLSGELDVVFIDVRKDAAAGRQYGVRVIPTQIFLDESGTELFRHQGFMSREDILAKWRELGVALEG